MYTYTHVHIHIHIYDTAIHIHVPIAHMYIHMQASSRVATSYGVADFSKPISAHGLAIHDIKVRDTARVCARACTLGDVHTWLHTQYVDVPCWDVRELWPFLVPFFVSQVQSETRPALGPSSVQRK